MLTSTITATGWIFSLALFSGLTDARLHDVEINASEAADRHFESIKRRNAKIFARYPVDHGRIITVSEACESETLQLYNNSEVSAAGEQMINQATPQCDLGDDAACRIDYSEFSAEFISTCSINGGQIYTGDFTLSCSEQDISLKFETQNFPNCVGASCVKDDLDETFDEAIEELEDALQGDGVSCEVSSSSSACIAFAVSTAIISSALFLL
eukprot:CAMPEP_0116014516 /NCGR_PEP_ID=MMETSP0321-20121206/6314_1 /TAXON_ID=163516 /ORGANISM="Leptocylindrus danicus var. danicus, Strain B650" /LENGTH=211 /DNA_ID=CAMNT_0003484163 /DNA_START=88 /DNA_END=723 /DNA_ORIENTATION=+